MVSVGMVRPQLIQPDSLSGNFALWMFVAIACLSCLTAPQVAWAEGGNSYFLPQTPEKPDHGLYLKVDARSVAGSGYRPITLQVSTANGKPSPLDRRIRVQIQPRSYYFYRGNSIPAAAKTILLEEGQQSSTTTLLVPQHYMWNSLSAGVWEDGQELEEFRSQNLAFNYYQSQWTEALPATIVVHRNAPTLGDRDNWVGRQMTREKKGNPVEFPDYRVFLNEHCVPTSQDPHTLMLNSKFQALSILPYYPRTSIMQPAALPEDWLVISSADLIVIELRDLKSLAEQSPKKLRALKNWVDAGGNLMLWNCGDNATDEIDALMPWNPLSPAHAWKLRTTKELKQLRGSQYALTKSTMSGNPYSQGVYRPFVVQDGQLISSVKNVTDEHKELFNSLRIWERSNGFGYIVAVEQNPFPGDSELWKAVFNAFPNARLSWVRRHGMSRLRENSGFWYFLVPGVGTAPVTSFQVLITLFVIVIGPVNYLSLRAMGRLNLLIFTVPTGAISITLFLMVYALLSDGVTTRTRIRSVSLLDQVHGQGVTWSRQSYYSVLASTSGLTFPTDTAIYEYEQHPGLDHSGHKMIEWSDAGQNLRGGYFRSRVTHQFLVVRPFESKRQLSVTESSAGLKVENKLGSRVKYLIATDSNGKQFFGQDLADTASAQLTNATADQLGMLRETLANADMQLPDGFDQRAYQRRSNQRRQSTNYYNTVVEHATISPSFGTSSMELAIFQARNNKFTLDGKKNYFAIIEHFPETPMGIDAVPGEKSMSVIQGCW